MLRKFVKILGGDPNKREIDKISVIIERVNDLEAKYESLDDTALKAQTAWLRLRLAKGETLDDIMPEAFAAVREASKRTIGLRHYDVQLIGGATLHLGKIAEMRTGEGKTLVATLPLYLNALALNPDWVNQAQKKWGGNPGKWTFEPIKEIPVGRGVHLVTVNDYLARRDARWMGPIFDLLDLKVGVLQMAARTENGKKAFLLDLEHTSPLEDQHQLRMVLRGKAYAADITYGTNSEFGFDFLRDNLAMSLDDRVQRGHYYAIVDEVDNILIDEARTPLIISGQSQEDTSMYNRMAQIVRFMQPDHYEVNERDHTVTLSGSGESYVEEQLGQPLRDPERPEDLTLEQERLLSYLEQALRAQFLFRRNKDYLVQGGKVIIIDEFTGRLMPGRRWSDGLHQAVEAKENVRVQSESVTQATITIQNYFRMYEKLAGMTGTAVTESEEFYKIYKLDVLSIPTNLEFQASHSESGLIEMGGVDEQGYKYQYYARPGSKDQPVFWKRKDYPDIVYRTEEAKLRSIVQEILRYHLVGRPILVGTSSVELSEKLSNRLKADLLGRLAKIMIIRDRYIKTENREEDGRLIPELQVLNERLEDLEDLDQVASPKQLINEVGRRAKELDRLVKQTSFLRSSQQTIQLFEPAPSQKGHQQFERSEQETLKELARLQGDIGKLQNEISRLRAEIFEPEQGMDDGKSDLGKPVEGRLDELDRLAKKLERSIKLAHIALKTKLTSLDLKNHLDVLINLLDPQRINGLPSPNASERLKHILENDIQHQVLNARKHTEESKMIERAGAFGSVTIATNMAGRGVDIKLGGSLEDYTIKDVVKILKRSGIADPYDMSLEDQEKALRQLSPEQYGIYGESVAEFLRYADSMEQIKALGGLHVIGSERHEARRIDNQLRGRSARQGDPGSSRFYLSMEDQLMRLFGGQQADSLLQRFKIDEAMPLEFNIVGRIVEQSQTRVEGNNFDVRKHLLEYDDVLNTQRKKVYEQRDRILTKQDLVEDVSNMLRDEVNQRVPEGLQDEGGPWKLLAWLEQIQPAFPYGNPTFPSFMLRLLIDDVFSRNPDRSNEEQLSPDYTIAALSDIVAASLTAEKEHVLQVTKNVIEQIQEKLDELIEEGNEALDAFRDDLSRDDQSTSRRPDQLITEMSQMLPVAVKSSPELTRALRQNPSDGIDLVRAQMEETLVSQAIARILGAVQRHILNSQVQRALDLQTNNLTDESKNDLESTILERIEEGYENTIERYLGKKQADGRWSGGQITKDLEAEIGRTSEPIDDQALLRLLISLPTEWRLTAFDKKTHRRAWQRSVRLTYIYYAAHLITNTEANRVTADVLDHLEQAQEEIFLEWGRTEMTRLANLTLADFDEWVQEGIYEVLGESRHQELANQQISKLAESDQELIQSELGRQALTRSYRRLLLEIITYLWVDYLTQMEALRISISLESYAQRDPLVQYKNKGFELFQSLMNSMRREVVNRMFTYRPRETSSTQGGAGKPEGSQSQQVVEDRVYEVEDKEEVFLPEPQEEDLVLQETIESGQPVASDHSSSSKRRKSRKKR